MRHIPVVAATVCTAVALVAGGPVASQSEDWPSFLGPRRDGKSIEVGIRKDWADLEAVWVRDVGQGYSMPSVADGALYHFDREGSVTRLTRLDASTGREVWQVVTGATDYEDFYGYSDGPRASPVVDENRVFTFGADGWLRARRTDDGAPLWEIDGRRDFGIVQNFFGEGSTPIVEGDLLIAQIGGSPPGSSNIHTGAVRGNDSAIVAFDKKTGAVRYRFGDELSSYASPVIASVGERRWGFAFLREGLVAFDPVAGRALARFDWRAPRLQSVNAATPVVVGDEVLITESYGPGGALLRFDGERFDIVWRDPGHGRPKLASHWSTPVVHEGYIYASSGEKSGAAELRCLDWRTGEIQWSQPGLRRSSLLYADGHLIVLTEYGDLLLVEARPDAFRAVASVRLTAADGRPLLRHPAWNAPILAHGLLYVRGEGRLLAVRLID